VSIFLRGPRRTFKGLRQIRSGNPSIKIRCTARITFVIQPFPGANRLQNGLGGMRKTGKLKFAGLDQ
jgi:hypothetical protein